jgi:hypothetical protein
MAKGATYSNSVDSLNEPRGGAYPRCVRPGICLCVGAVPRSAMSMSMSMVRVALVLCSTGFDAPTPTSFHHRFACICNQGSNPQASIMFTSSPAESGRCYGASAFDGDWLIVEARLWFYWGECLTAGDGLSGEISVVSRRSGGSNSTLKSSAKSPSTARNASSQSCRVPL